MPRDSRGCSCLWKLWSVLAQWSRNGPAAQTQQPGRSLSYSVTNTRAHTTLLLANLQLCSSDSTGHWLINTQMRTTPLTLNLQKSMLSLLATTARSSQKWNSLALNNNVTWWYDLLNKNRRRRAFAAHAAASRSLAHLHCWLFIHAQFRAHYILNPIWPQNSLARSLNNYCFANKWLLVPCRKPFLCLLSSSHDGEFFELLPLICSVLYWAIERIVIQRVFTKPS